MLDIPSRQGLASLTEAAQAVAPTRAIGFARALKDGRVSVLSSHPNGLTEYAVAASELPDVLSLDAVGVQQADYCGERSTCRSPRQTSSQPVQRVDDRRQT